MHVSVDVSYAGVGVSDADATDGGVLPIVTVLLATDVPLALPSLGVTVHWTESSLLNFDPVSVDVLATAGVPLTVHAYA